MKTIELTVRGRGGFKVTFIVDKISAIAASNEDRQAIIYTNNQQFMLEESYEEVMKKIKGE